MCSRLPACQLVDYLAEIFLMELNHSMDHITHLTRLQALIQCKQSIKMTSEGKTLSRQQTYLWTGTIETQCPIF